MALHLLKVAEFVQSYAATEEAMSDLLKWALAFFVISLIAALFGFGGIASGAADIARILFFVFLGICVVLFLLGLFVVKSV
jgi:uncharacterized membrane protein YtjA (UPF0391 family)